MLAEEVLVGTSDQVSRNAAGPEPVRVHAPDDRHGDSRRLAHHQFGSRGDLVGDGHLGDQQLAAEGVLGYLIRSIVENPDEVRIETSGDERCTFSVTVADGDMGRVIGKRGRVANAIRTIVRAAAVRDETEVDVDFVD